MIKYFCDKCGKEIESFIGGFMIKVEPPELRTMATEAETGTYILCYNCVKDLNKWIRSR
jgi:DNA-directed RNA polymerase subunit RPC12/RpoP